MQVTCSTSLLSCMQLTMLGCAPFPRWHFSPPLDGGGGGNRATNNTRNVAALMAASSCFRVCESVCESVRGMPATPAIVTDKFILRCTMKPKLDGDNPCLSSVSLPTVVLQHLVLPWVSGEKPNSPLLNTPW
ncbi:uncharacterized protein GGS25DRAFT_114857 [Hypoxylon fragiforme]|uniref:uncharacterized protein n=1 Tax=Hypoxylon fragiforme TaxID=63214 RepID=UPI0020C723D6|nr:uncharacterized protein GGS25DRAFT_114857 [Hypoxylon fragiforme]KAI2612306.1 hypothetical protein GGS25DRAFT_114857 [Hypoxylon fragiforme]